MKLPEVPLTPHSHAIRNVCVSFSKIPPKGCLLLIGIALLDSCFSKASHTLAPFLPPAAAKRRVDFWDRRYWHLHQSRHSFIRLSDRCRNLLVQQDPWLEMGVTGRPASQSVIVLSRRNQQLVRNRIAQKLQ
jgi:hypothetical protein